MAKDAKPNDHKGLAHRRGSSPDTLQRDGAKCDGGREFVGDAIGRWHDQISRHADIFGMERRLSTGARHAISGKQIVDALTDRDHGAGERITHRLRLREMRADQFPGLRETVAAHHLYHPAHLIGALQRPLPERQIGGPDAG